MQCFARDVEGAGANRCGKGKGGAAARALRRLLPAPPAAALVAPTAAAAGCCSPGCPAARKLPSGRLRASRARWPRGRPVVPGGGVGAARFGSGVCGLMRRSRQSPGVPEEHPPPPPTAPHLSPRHHSLCALHLANPNARLCLHRLAWMSRLRNACTRSGVEGLNWVPSCGLNTMLQGR